MVEDLNGLISVAREIYPSDLPRPLGLVEAALRVRSGENHREVARSLSSTPRRMEQLAASADPLQDVLHTTLAEGLQAMPRAREVVGQLLLGEIAEQAFVEMYRDIMGTSDLKLQDDRGARGDTDYRVLNGQGRPVFRINIKFHGSRFQKAPELVGLDSEDCFALATYKIWQGLQKHEKEALPYVFVIVGVSGLRGADAGQVIPEEMAHLLGVVHAARGIPGKRAIEEHVVAHLLSLLAQPGDEIQRFKKEVRAADWYALSARKADKLLRNKLFERVFAVRVRGFARNYRNAELDMHFSLAEDLTPLADFLRSARERGLHGLAVELERGVM